MAKWADYLISAVRFNAKRTHIDRVKVHEDKDSSVGTAFEETRAQVIRSIEDSKISYCTIFKDGSAQYQRGQRVEVVLIDGEKFIKTLADRSKADNLDNLPEF